MDGNTAVSIEPERIHDPVAALQGDRVAFLACATVAEEMRPLLPPGVECQILEFDLQINPGSLKQAVHDAVDDLATRADTIVLGYGLCAMAVAGLKSDACTLVVPRVDDCTGTFLGSSPCRGDDLWSVGWELCGGRARVGDRVS